MDQQISPFTRSRIQPQPSSAPILIPSSAAAIKKRNSVKKSLLNASPSTKRSYTHNYHDHSNDPIYIPPGGGIVATAAVNNNNNNGKGGVPVQFPERLYRMLMEVGENEQEEIVSWQPHGRCFIVHQPQKFLQEIIPK
jgi:hypothetical protein